LEKAIDCGISQKLIVDGTSFQPSPVSKEAVPKVGNLIPESCTKYRSEAQKALCLNRCWSDFDPQAYYLYGEDQNHETSFKGKALQALVDSWCKIQVML
jgi:hypothetical protein